MAASSLGPKSSAKGLLRRRNVGLGERPRLPGEVNCILDNHICLVLYCTPEYNSTIVFKVKRKENGSANKGEVQPYQHASSDQPLTSPNPGEGRGLEPSVVNHVGEVQHA